MCNHKLTYHSEHADIMTVYCTVCNAQWVATMFIAPRKEGEEPTYLDRPAQPARPAPKA
jgi:hypothetical protein